MPRTVPTSAASALALGNFYQCDLWTFVLPQGTQRWSGGAAVTIGTTTWNVGPVIVRGIQRDASGTEVSTLDLVLGGAFLLGGITLSALAETGSFDDAELTSERIYMPTAETTPTSDHKILLFHGFAAEVTPHGKTIEITAKTLLYRGDEEIPRRLIGPMCPWRWGETRCGIDIDLWDATDTVDTGTTAQSIVLVTGSSNFLVPGAIMQFATGERRVIQRWTSGTKTALLDSPLAAIPTGSVTIWRGCDKRQATCNTTYSNLARFGGFPQIPGKN